MLTSGQKHHKKFAVSNLDNATLSVARCELSNLTDCISEGLSIGVSHIGGDFCHSVITIHKVALDKSYCVTVMNVIIGWDMKNTIHQFKEAILMARKIICDHNKLLNISSCNAQTAAHKQNQAIALFNEQNQPFSTANSKLVLEEVNGLFNDARNIKHSTIELNQTQTSEGMEAYPFQQLSITESISAFNYVQSSVNYGDYQPLNLWPSAIDREKSTGLNMVCQKLAEAELYISLLLAEKAA
ncbi:MAG: hypothetical protein ACJAUY_000634 [Cognaticolwellia sp.]|jgi:hypothetical protein